MVNRGAVPRLVLAIFVVIFPSSSSSSFPVSSRVRFLLCIGHGFPSALGSEIPLAQAVAAFGCLVGWLPIVGFWVFRVFFVWLQGDVSPNRDPYFQDRNSHGTVRGYLLCTRIRREPRYHRRKNQRQNGNFPVNSSLCILSGAAAPSHHTSAPPLLLLLLLLTADLSLATHFHNNSDHCCCARPASTSGCCLRMHGVLIHTMISRWRGSTVCLES